MSSSRTRVKMCGMTRKEDVAHAMDLGVDGIGLIFYPKSKRYISVKEAKILLTDLPPFVSVVAVVVNPERDTVYQLLEELPIDLLQFHGDESPEFCAQFNIPYIKAIHAISAAQIQQDADKFCKARAILLDTASETCKGGTGLTFDWRMIPTTLSIPYILAGGINEYNVKDALASCTPHAVDICSGVEILPGVKDHNKMSRFIKTLWGKE